MAREMLQVEMPILSKEIIQEQVRAFLDEENSLKEALRQSELESLKHENDLLKVNLEQQIKGVWDQMQAWRGVHPAVEVGSETSSESSRDDPPPPLEW